jgi:hypothetical protein
MLHRASLTRRPGWNYQARSEAFLVQMANEPETVVPEIAQGTWPRSWQLSTGILKVNLLSLEENIPIFG